MRRPRGLPTREGSGAPTSATRSGRPALSARPCRPAAAGDGGSVRALATTPVAAPRRSGRRRTRAPRGRRRRGPGTAAGRRGMPAYRRRESLAPAPCRVPSPADRRRCSVDRPAGGRARPSMGSRPPSGTVPRAPMRRPSGGFPEARRFSLGAQPFAEISGQGRGDRMRFPDERTSARSEHPGRRSNAGQQCELITDAVPAKLGVHRMREVAQQQNTALRAGAGRGAACVAQRPQPPSRA